MQTLSKPNQSQLRIATLAAAAALAATIAVPLCAGAKRQVEHDSEDPAIAYATTAPQDAVTRLQQRLDAGQAHLTFDPARGWLPSVLKQLGISPASQMLVFSKTSFQHTLISPQTPRALYFNDSAYIGWVQGGDVLEFAAMDPVLGAVFYLLPQRPSEHPKVVRINDECLECHESSMTRGIPGFIMRSVFARPDGQPELRAGTFITTDQSPFAERWGGWFVSGTHGAMRHMGNVTAAGDGETAVLDTNAGANVTDLHRLLNVHPYLAGSSDIVALMVAEHQTHLQNLIIMAGYGTRIALRYEADLNRELHRPAGSHWDSTSSRIRGACEPLVKGLLFSGEAPLTDAVRGVSGFAEHFAAVGPRDRLGRSLRDLDLRTRLFRYPCSYLIYSQSFDLLPTEAKEYVYGRLTEILTAPEPGKDFANLSAADRKAILEILEATKPEFARYGAGHSKAG